MILNLIAYPSWLNPDNPGADQEGYVTYSGLQIPINIQPESPVMTSLAEGEIFATYHFFTAYSGLQTGWRLSISGISNSVYTVRGVQRYDWGPGQHYEGTLIKEHQ